MLDREGKTGNAYGMEIPANVIIGTDRKIVGFFNGPQEIENLVRAIQDGRITTTHPNKSNLKDFIERKQVLIDEEPFRMGRAEDHKPTFPPSLTVHVAPSQSDERSNSSGDDFWSLRGYTFKEAINLLYDVNSIRMRIPARLDTEEHYDFSVVLPRSESQEQMKDRIRKGLQDYFHVNVIREDRLVDVYVLSLAANGKLPPAKPHADEGMGGFSASDVSFESPGGSDDAIAEPKPATLGGLRGVSTDNTVDEFCHTLESALDRPMVNETNLKGEFLFHVKDGGGAEGNFQQRLREQLGLVITPGQREVEMVVIDPR